MKHVRKEFKVGSLTFVILRFEPAVGDSVPDDNLVTTVAAAEKLRSVTRGEFYHFLAASHQGVTDRPIVAFGNVSRGSAMEGGFPGTPYLDIDGKVKIVGDWTRRSGQWQGDWEFIFVSAASSAVLST